MTSRFALPVSGPLGMLGCVRATLSRSAKRCARACPFIANRKGVAAVEFALIVPLLLRCIS
jgi:hypothetical protein